MHSFHYFCAAAPIDFHVTINEFNNGLLNWLPPNVLKMHGNILYYLVNCSADYGIVNEQTLTVNTTNEMIL